MNKMILLVMAVCFTAFAGEYAVVVNKSGPAELSAADIKRIFTGKITEKDGVATVPVAYDLANAVSAEFLKEILDMSVSEYRSFWMAQQVKGTGTAPVVQKTPEGLIGAVAAAPGGIGFIEKSKVTDAVKVVTVK